MNSTSNFNWHKSYFVIDKNGSLNTKKLNFFERCFRKLGLYSDTRLAVVSQLAQKKLFEGTFTTADKVSLTKILTKAREKKKLNRICLGEVQNNQYKIHYESIINETTTSFWIKLMTNQKIERESIISVGIDTIYPANFIVDPFNSIIDNQNHLIVDNIYDRSTSETPGDFMTNPRDELAKHSYVFLSKILIDSKLNYLKMSQTKLVGSVLLAKTYGFNGQQASGSPEGDPAHFTLDRDQATKIAPLCKLNAKVSLGFLLRQKEQNNIPDAY